MTQDLDKATSNIANTTKADAAYLETMKTAVVDAIEDIKGFDITAVSYTHLDVYKRQLYNWLAEVRCTSVK